MNGKLARLARIEKKLNHAEFEITQQDKLTGEDNMEVFPTKTTKNKLANKATSTLPESNCVIIKSDPVCDNKSEIETKRSNCAINEIDSDLQVSNNKKKKKKRKQKKRSNT